MSSITIIVAPFHAGVSDFRVGNGPHYLLSAGLADALSVVGSEIEVVEIEPVDAFEGEIGRSFEVKRRVASAVAAVAGRGRFPLVLAGNCNASIGTYAGLGAPDADVIWFDAHADFDTPDEATSGYFDGMGVATLAGQCWHALAASVPGFRPLDTRRLIYCGIRDFEPGQREKVEAHAIRAVYGGSGRSIPFASELDAAVAEAARRVLIHLDLDCLDTSVGHANEYAAPGGLSGQDLNECMLLVASRSALVGMTIASFDPDMPGSSAIAEAGVRAAQTIAAALG